MQFLSRLVCKVTISHSPIKEGRLRAETVAKERGLQDKHALICSRAGLAEPGGEHRTTACDALTFSDMFSKTIMTVFSQHDTFAYSFFSLFCRWLENLCRCLRRAPVDSGFHVALRVQRRAARAPWGLPLLYHLSTCRLLTVSVQ